MERDFISIKDTLTDILSRLKELENSKNGMIGLSTGFYDLDYAIKGLNKSNLIIIGSRPAMGKTALAFNIATNVALKENIPVAIFNLEMSKEQCTNRILSLQAMVDNNRLNTGKLDVEDWQKIKETSEHLLNAEIYIDDTPTISVDEIKEKCIRLKQEKNLGLIVIDYLQLMQYNENCSSREQEMKEITIALKNLAEELNIPIITSYQLSRTLEKREDKRPVLQDIETESIIKNADIIMFLYRDDYYNIDSEKRSIAEVIIAKNKYGNCSTVELAFMKEYLKFENLEYKEE